MVGRVNGPVDPILPYGEIIKFRRRLMTGDAMSRQEREDFAGSIVSNDDIGLLERFAELGNDHFLAGDTMLVLFSHGGVGNQNCLIRRWLESGDHESYVVDSAPVVLAECVRQLRDGTALRQLYEFADIPEVKLVLDQILSDANELPLDTMLHESVSQQLACLLSDSGRSPSNRRLWLLRTYGRYFIVQDYLRSLALQGRTTALASYAVHEGVIDWSILAAALPTTDSEMQLVANIAIDNVRRGANWDDEQTRDFMTKLREPIRSSILTTLEQRPWL
jgi:hypothetical protein